MAASLGCRLASTTLRQIVPSWEVAMQHVKEYRVLGLRTAEQLETEMNKLASDEYHFAGATETLEGLAIVIMERDKLVFGQRSKK
jgi:hypothetical protein